jgi:predicted secreted acid phosphatase
MLRALGVVAVSLPLLAFAAVPATADTTRTATTPAKLRASKKTYTKAVAAGFATATRRLDAQLRRHPRRPTVVLDIDETTMSNWACLDQTGFELGGLATCVVEGRSKAFAAAKQFIRHARARKAAIAFITAAPAAVCDARRANLVAQGIRGPFSLTCKPADYTDSSAVPYKSGARRALIRKGATIVLNVGDQRSDLAGGAARATVKLPNPIYVTT